MEHENEGDTNCYQCPRNNPHNFSKVTGRYRNQRQAETIQITALLRSARILRFEET